MKENFGTNYSFLPRNSTKDIPRSLVCRFNSRNPYRWLSFKTKSSFFFATISCRTKSCTYSFFQQVVLSLFRLKKPAEVVKSQAKSCPTHTQDTHRTATAKEVHKSHVTHVCSYEESGFELHSQFAGGTAKILFICKCSRLRLQSRQGTSLLGSWFLPGRMCFPLSYIFFAGPDLP